MGCRLWGRTESDTTEATQQQQQQQLHGVSGSRVARHIDRRCIGARVVCDSRVARHIDRRCIGARVVCDST